MEILSERASEHELGLAFLAHRTIEAPASHAISIRRPLPSTCSRRQRRTTSVLRMRWALPLRGVTGISELGSQDAEGAEKEMETEEAGDVEGGVCS